MRQQPPLKGEKEAWTGRQELAVGHLIRQQSSALLCNAWEMF